MIYVEIFLLSPFFVCVNSSAVTCDDLFPIVKVFVTFMNALSQRYSLIRSIIVSEITIIPIFSFICIRRFIQHEDLHFTTHVIKKAHMFLDNFSDWLNRKQFGTTAPIQSTLSDNQHESTDSSSQIETTFYPRIGPPPECKRLVFGTCSLRFYCPQQSQHPHRFPPAVASHRPHVPPNVADPWSGTACFQG